MSPSTRPSRRHWMVPLIALTCVVAGCTPGSGPGGGPTNVATVTTFSDSGDGTCDSTCSLRDAIALANTDATIDTVTVPAGTFVVGAPAARAAVHGRARAPRSARAAGGPSGEAFAVTSALTIEGAGAGSTVIDFSGEDYAVGWLASADLTLRSLTARNLGSGTAAQDRDLVRANPAAPGGSVTLDHVGIDHIQPAMAVTGVGPGASVVDVNPGSSVAVAVTSSTISDVGTGALGNLFRTGTNGPLTITDSTLARVPALVVGGLTSPIGAATGSLKLSRVIASDTAIAAPGQCLPGSAVLALENAVVDIAESYLGTGSDGPCGGTQAVQGSPFAGSVVLFRTANIGGSPPIVTVSRSTLDGQVSGNALVLLHFGPTTEGSNLEVTDSTLVGGASSAVLLLGSVLSGSKRNLKWSTIVTPPDQQAAGIRTGPLDHVPLAITSSVLAGTDAPTCVGPVTLGSGGNNTAVDDFCPLTGPGDTVTDPNLEQLGDHGGLGPTAAPRPNSPVVDTAGSCTGRDQRNVARPQGAACDRGAVEYAEGVR